MKKKYMTPSVEVEEFALTQTVASCAGVQINSLDKGCVLADPDSPPEFKDFANAGMFLDLNGTNPCSFAPTGMELDDKYCIHTAVSLVFNS